MIPTLNFDGDLQDRVSLATVLTTGGFAPAAAASKASQLADVAATLQATAAFLVPGRIEILGKHTDYAGGASLLSAASQGVAMVVSPRSDRTVHTADIRRGEATEFALDADLAPAIGEWSNYPMTVARRIARNFPEVRHGAHIAFAGDLPPAAGMSSSSALIVAFFLALAEVNDLWNAPLLTQNIANRTELAAYLATIENGQSFGPLAGDRGVGTAGGSEDHTAILCCRSAMLSQYAYCPLRHIRDVPMPNGHTFVVGTSGVVAEKTGAAMAKYNRASQLAAEISSIWRRETARDDPHLAAALESSPSAAEELRRLLETTPLASDGPAREELLSRFEHFRVENTEVMPAAISALAEGDLSQFGEAVDASQRAAEALLGNQIPETRHLAASARCLGATASSAFGAGFGGSVWSLVASEQVEDFTRAWREEYRRAFPAASAQFFASPPSPPAIRIVSSGE